MTTADKTKKDARNIQGRTGWRYQVCRMLCEDLGYEEVSKAVDEIVKLTPSSSRRAGAEMDLINRAKRARREKKNGS